MAFGKYKSSGDAPPSMAPLNFSRKMLDHGQSAELEIAAGPPTEADVDIDVREVYFLIMHFLSSGPCARTFVQIWNELLEHDLLPRRYHAWYSRNGAPSGDENDNGHSLPLNYQSLVERNPHIKNDHIIKLMKQLIMYCSPPLNRFSGGSFPGAADVPTLLGSGSFSLLGSDKNRELKKVNHLPQYLRWPHIHADQVHGLSLREIGGGFAKHRRSPSIRAACYAVAKPSTMVQKMQVIRKLRGHQNAVYCAIFDRSGRYVITGSDDRLVKIWSTETAFCLSSCRGHEGDITDLAVSANNALVASASNDFIIRVWRLPDGLPISILRGHTSAVTAIAFSPRPNSVYQLLSSSDDGSCRIWDARYSQCTPRVYVPKPSDVVTGRSSNPTLNASPQVPQILCCAFNASGTVFVTGSSDTYARVWNACKTSQEDSELPNHEMDLLAGHENDVNYVQFSGCAVSSKFTTIDTSKEDNMPKFKNSWFTHDNIVTCSRDGSAIIWIPRSRRSHGKVGRWTRAYHLKVPPPPMPPQPPRGGPRQRFQPTPRGVNMIVWSLDNRFVLAAIMDCRICVWNASDGSLVHSLIGHTESTFVLDVHPFNPRIAMSAGYDGKTIIWDIWEGIPVRIYETGRFKLVDGKFSPDGTSVVLSDEVGQIFIIATGQGESQKDAQYDQFFLGDYRPLIQDVHGSVLDQETQLAPYRRNMQDLLCDSNMIPYPEPYQSMYQRRRLGNLGIEWRPSSLKFAVGPSSNVNGADFQILQIVDLERWLDPQPEFLDAMDFELENEVQSDDNDSEYNINEEYSSEGEHGSVSISSTVDPECSAEESEAEYSNEECLRRSKRKKLKTEAEFTTSSGRRVKRRNLDQHDGTVTKRHKKKRKRNGKLASKKKYSKAKSHRPQRRAARNALTFLSQMGEVSTEGEYEDESETYSSENDSIFQEYNTHSNDSESSMMNTQTEHTHEKKIKRDENEVIEEPPLHVEVQVNAGVKKRLVLRLPIRDSKNTIFSASTKNGINEKNDVITSSTKKNFDDSAEKNYSSHYDPGQASGNNLGDVFSQNNIGCKIAEHNENIGHQPLSSGYKDGKVKWGEVKTRTSKRIRVGDGIIADPCTISNTCFEISGINMSNSNGHVKLEIEHGLTTPGTQFSADVSTKRNSENELQLTHGVLDNLGGEENQESAPDYAHQLSEFDQSSRDADLLKRDKPIYGSRTESKDKETDEFTGSKELMASHEHHGVAGRLDTKTSFDNSQDSENNEQPVCKKLKFKSKSSMYDPGSSSSKISLVDDNKASGLLSEHNNICTTHEYDADSSGTLDIGGWNTQSRQRDKNGIYIGCHKSLKITRERGFSRGTHGLEEHLSNYDNINDGQNSAFIGSMPNGHHHTRSLGKRAVAEKSFSMNDAFTMRGNYNSAETSKTRLKFSLNGCDPQPASKTTVGLRSARNRRENYNYHDLGCIDKRKARRCAKKLLWLMLLEHEEGYRYIPQLGDEVAYLRQGHAEYLDAIKSHECGPWKLIKGDIKAVEFCKVSSFEYSTLPGSGESCCKLTLEFTDPSSYAFGKAFKLTLPELVEFPDFIVERTRYDASIERNWTSRDKCQVWWRNEDGEGGSWWEGRIISIKSKSSEFPESPWERYVIQYRNDSSGQHLHSPWELHDTDTPWDHPHIDELSRDKLLSSFEKIEQMSMRNKDNLGLQKLDHVSQKSDFLNRFPVPLSLEVIKARLENNYYRTLDAVRHDTSVMISNAQTYLAKSAEFASKIRRLSELIVRAFPSQGPKQFCREKRSPP